MYDNEFKREENSLFETKPNLNQDKVQPKHVYQFNAKMNVWYK